MVLGTVGQMSLDISSGGIGFNAIALALLAGNRPGGVVARRAAVRRAHDRRQLMGVKTGIPLDLLFFIMALVIMFVAASGLIRAHVAPRGRAIRRPRDAASAAKRAPA